MRYTRAHLAELGLTLWRTRADQAALDSLASSQVVDAVPESATVRPSVAAPTPAVTAVPRATPKVMDAPTGTLEQRRQDASEVAERLARIKAMNWDALEACVRGLSRPPATQAVFGVGDRNAQVFVIGEAPGADEDARGEPFVGKAGQLLDQMLQAINLSRNKNAYIANVCKFRPPNNRDPRPEEISEDMPYLLRQIQLVKPKLILAVGRVAAQSLMQCDDPLGRMRGKSLKFGQEAVPLVVTYHPAYLLRSPRDKAKAWQDLKRVRQMLAEA